MKEIKYLNKWRDILKLWIGRLNLKKMSIPPKLTYGFNAHSIKILARFFCWHRQIDSKFMWKDRDPKGQNVFNKMGGITLPNIRAYCKFMTMKTVWYWWRDRHIDQWNRIDNPENDSHKYAKLIFDKGAKV